MIEVERQRTALVTGGAVRIGRAIAVALAQDGHDVAIVFRSSEEAARDAAREIEALGRRCLPIQADLTKAEAAEQVALAARDAFSRSDGVARMDVLVNSAASFREMPLMEVDAAEWDSVMALNVRAPHLLTRACAPMLRAARGSVVNITDLSAFQAWTVYPHHAVSKAALAHLTRVQARALAPDVRVNAIAPGAVLPPDDWPEARWQALADRAVLRRVGSPEDVVEAVRYLTRAGFVTGHVLPVDGGRLLGPSGPPDVMPRDDGG
jgi:NAD(P)-dependent dehydrogenase (short-subunit alcohol dehydrogenase family)